MARGDDDPGTPDGGRSIQLIVGGILGAALALFVVQNTERTTVTWLFFDAEAPLWLVLVITAAATLVIVELLGGARRRRKRRS